MRRTFLTLAALSLYFCAATHACADSMLLSCTGNHASDLNTFGAPVSVTVPAGASYAAAGVSSSVNSTFFSQDYVSSVSVIAGTNSTGVDQTVKMSWRTKAPGEMTTAPLHPLLPGVTDYLGSDVVKLENVTGIFVLQMSYLVGPSDNLANGTVFLGWLDFNDSSFPNTKDYDSYFDSSDPAYQAQYPNKPVWKNAANKSRDCTTDENFYAKSFDDFRKDNPGVLSDHYVGDWGIDTEHNLAWAVLDSSNFPADGAIFAVVPEPGMVSMLMAGAVAMVLPMAAKRWRRRTAK